MALFLLGFERFSSAWFNKSGALALFLRHARLPETSGVLGEQKATRQTGRQADRQAAFRLAGVRIHFWCLNTTLANGGPRSTIVKQSAPFGVLPPLTTVVVIVQ